MPPLLSFRVKYVFVSIIFITLLTELLSSKYFIGMKWASITAATVSVSRYTFTNRSLSVGNIRLSFTLASTDLGIGINSRDFRRLD